MVNFKLSLLKSGSEFYDITDMVKQIVWSGDINTMPRKIEVEAQLVTAYDTTQIIHPEMGNFVIFYINSIEKFRGYIFTTSTDQTGLMTITAYDQLIYATKNEDTMIVKNQKASDLVRSELEGFHMKVGSVEDTVYVIPKLVFTGSNVSDIIQQCLDETKSNTGTSYFLSTALGVISMVSRKNAAVTTIEIDDVITATRDISIEDTKTKVTVTKGNIDPDPSSDSTDTPYSVVEAYDDENAAKFGLLQHVESVDDTSTTDAMNAKAAELLGQLKEPTETITVDFIGVDSCVTGTQIKVVNRAAAIEGQYYITADTHTIDSAGYKMELQLSTKIE